MTNIHDFLNWQTNSSEVKYKTFDLDQLKLCKEREEWLWDRVKQSKVITISGQAISFTVIRGSLGDVVGIVQTIDLS